MAPRPELFEVHPSSGVPIYRQLVDQVHALVAGGRLRPGDMLPSVREVAKTAEVNPMTVSKAYSRLEADGVIERVRGQGMRVLQPTASGTLRQRRHEFRQLLAPAVHRALQLGLNEEQIRQVIGDLLDELIIKQDGRSHGGYR
ncbi:MAG: GntR family transcriptional regulator [Planctomycetota bacterium]|nr:MAG: GntR family transcriptional regulator [Planctomycetota bacterium]